MLLLVDSCKATENGDVVRKSCISGLNKLVSLKTLKDLSESLYVELLKNIRI